MLTSLSAPDSADPSDRLALLRAELARYVGILSRDHRVRTVLVFGSVARGAPQEDSDIDLVVVLDTDAPFFRRLAELRRILRPVVATDILAYTPAELERLVAERPFVRDEILGSGRVLYERAA